MKLQVVKSFDLLRVFLRAKEVRFVSALLLREALGLSLVALAIFLSLESILPGTVSLRTGVLFFILGIALLLMAQRALSQTIPERENDFTKYSRGKKRFFLGIFSLWILSLLGNSLFGFHPIIAMSILLITPFLLWLFLALEGDK